MSQQETILQLLAEGGSVSLYRSGDKFFYTTNETELIDLLNEEDIDESMLHPKVHEFNSFDSAFKSLMNRYLVFSLWPGFVHPEFKARIRESYLRHKKKNPEGIGSRWESMLD